MISQRIFYSRSVIYLTIVTFMFVGTSWRSRIVMQHQQVLLGTSSRSGGTTGSSSSSTSSIVAHALSTSSSSSSSRSALPQQPIRILCFGDSLTAGTSPPFVEEYPYAPHLQAALQQQIFPSFSEQEKVVEVTVRHMGYPGWTASQLLESANDVRGLRTLMRRVQDPPLSLVILLAGSNDLGYQMDPQQQIVPAITALHRLCTFEENIAHTIAIAVPPSQYQVMVNPDAAKAAHLVNQGLREFCENHQQSKGKTTYFPFPFQWTAATGGGGGGGGDETSSYWSPDGLHFSPQGYKFLGESLAPVVKQILLRNMQQQQQQEQQ